MQKMHMMILFAFMAFVMLAQSAFAKPIAVQTDAGLFLLPFQVVNGTELYSFREGKGFAAAETVLWSKGRYQFTFGAAAVLGSDANVPFVAIQHRLNPAIFDTSDNDLQFGVWVGRPSRQLDSERPRTLWGVKASIPLW